MDEGAAKETAEMSQKKHHPGGEARKNWSTGRLDKPNLFGAGARPAPAWRGHVVCNKTTFLRERKASVVREDRALVTKVMLVVRKSKRLLNCGSGLVWDFIRILKSLAFSVRFVTLGGRHG